MPRPIQTRMALLVVLVALTGVACAREDPEQADTTTPPAADQAPTVTEPVPDDPVPDDPAPVAGTAPGAVPAPGSPTVPDALPTLAAFVAQAAEICAEPLPSPPADTSGPNTGAYGLELLDAVEDRSRRLAGLEVDEAHRAEVDANLVDPARAAARAYTTAQARLQGAAERGFAAWQQAWAEVTAVAAEEFDADSRAWLDAHGLTACLPS